jgi:hypothetical protein
MPSQVVTKRRVKRRQQRLRLVSKNAKHKVRSVRKHRKTAKKVMRGGWPKKIYFGIIYDKISIVIDSKLFDNHQGDNNKINYILPIFIIVMIGSDLYLFFNKNMTLEEITKILKNIIEINTDVILDPPIQLPTVSADNYVVPTYNRIAISNITDIAKITDWSLSTEHDDAPSRQLLKNIFSDMLEDPFQHISKRFIKFKKTGVFSATFEKNIYSGEINDKLSLDSSSLTKHTFTSPPPDVVTERLKNLFDEKVNLSDKDIKLSYLINRLTPHIKSDTHLTQLYKQYIPNEKIDLTVEEYEKPESHSKETEEIKIDVTRVGPLNESNAITSSDLIAKNVLNSINDYMGTVGRFTPLPPGWLIPRPSAVT